MSTTASAPTALSLRRRALLAVALTVTFYLFALGTALVLIVGPIALWLGDGTGNLWLTIALVGAGVTILRAIMPVRDHFDPPGPELRREDHPKLHALLDDVAERVGEAPADAVYLDLEVNAWVREHRKRRVMALGLPLLATLSDEELCAVIAHEYGHYTGGDTRFEGWIWRTRVAVLKTVRELAQSDKWFRRYVLRWPFHGYAVLFLRLTNALSRRAEFAADAVSARAASPEAAGRALRRIDAVGSIFDGYWRSDVAPMLESERRPAIAAGFASMTSHAELAAPLDDIVRADLEGEEPDPYSSHPTLRQRLEALGVPVEAAAPEPVATPATHLLADVPELERALLRDRFGDEVAAFRPADWSEADAVHIERRQQTAQELGSAFPAHLTFQGAGTAAMDLPARREDLRSLLPEEDRDAPDEAIDDLALDVLTCLLFTAAHRAGVEITAPPGEPIRIHHGGSALDPWELLPPIARGEAEPATWEADPVVRALAQTPLRASEERGGRVADEATA